VVLQLITNKSSGISHKECALLTLGIGTTSKNGQTEKFTYAVRRAYIVPSFELQKAWLHARSLCAASAPFPHPSTPWACGSTYSNR